MLVKGIIYINNKYSCEVDGIEYKSQFIECDLLEFIYKIEETKLSDKLDTIVGFKVCIPRSFNIEIRTDKKYILEFWNKFTKKDK